MVEILPMLVIVALIIFGLLWLVIETGAKVGDRISDRKMERARTRRDQSMRNSTR